MQFLPHTTPVSPSAFFKPDHDTRKRVAVVGNGPLTTQDRVSINNHTNVVRFNDYYRKNWLPGDRITVHCSTKDQFKSPWADPNVTEWVIGKNPDDLMDDTMLYTWTLYPSNVRMYRDTFRWTVALGIEPASVLAPWFDVYRAFPNCTKCGDRCLSKNAASGFSRGAVVLNALEQDAEVARIVVFGMNWKGPSGHVDFLFPTIVSECCTKCTIHPTHSSNYGGLDPRSNWKQWLDVAVWSWSMELIPLWILLPIVVWCCLRRRHRLARDRAAAVLESLKDEFDARPAHPAHPAP